MGLKNKIHNFLRNFGFDFVRYDPKSCFRAREAQLLQYLDVDVVLDVGANKGQYGKRLRDFGFKGRIVSFEPLRDVYKELLTNAATSQPWQSLNYALGDSEGIIQINVSSNSVSSSILEILPYHICAAPESRYIGKEEIDIRPLDSVFNEFCSKGQKILLKIDAQGYEKSILDGARKSFPFIDVIQLEMSLVHLYQNQMLMHQICTFMYDKGYYLISLERGFMDCHTLQLLQVDGIFRRYQ